MGTPLDSVGSLVHTQQIQTTRSGKIKKHRVNARLGTADRNFVVHSISGGKPQPSRTNPMTPFLKKAAEKALEDGNTRFDKAKLPIFSSLSPELREKVTHPLPKTDLTRVLTGDVPPHFIQGLGRMQVDPDDPTKLIPADGYKDVFVSSMGEYEKVGIFLQLPTSKENITLNDPVDIAEKLDLKDEDIAKVRRNGIWLIILHPGLKLAIPTQRKSEWNPYYVEGGATASGQREWVTPNIPIEKEARAGNIHIYKISPDRQTEEWKFWNGRLISASQRSVEIHIHITQTIKAKI